jgi:hypothetical protein
MMIPGPYFYNRMGDPDDIKGVLERSVPSDTLLECEECEEKSPAGAWETGWAYCETCGDHDAICCPYCGCAHDGIFSHPRLS